MRGSVRVVLDARVSGDHFPGIGRVAVELGHALAREAEATGDVEVSFLVPPASAGRRAGALPPPHLEAADSPFSLAQHWSVPHLLAKSGADVYHSLFYLMPLRPGVPVVLTLMDVIPLVRPETQPAWKRAAFTLSLGAAIARADRLVAISESTRRDVRERFGLAPDRVRAVPIGVDARFAPVSVPAVDALRARLGLARPYLLYVGSNKPHKNLPRLVEAFLAIAPSRPGIDLTVAGVWDPRYGEARERARAGGEDGTRVRFLGPVDDADLPALYSGALAFAFPSLYEGFGLPVLEAMACGAPVVCGDGSSLPEVAGDAALLVDARSTDALAGALARLCDDDALRADLARRGPARAAAFPWSRTARAYLDLYREIARR